MKRGARKFFDKIMFNATCRECGSQPVVFHDPTFMRHDRNNSLRVGRIVHDGGSPMDVLLEVLKCVPLCRRCHRAEHTYRGFCIKCGGESSKYTRKMCGNCYGRWLSTHRPKKEKGCVDCKRKMKLHSSGRCMACYQRWKKINTPKRKCIECEEKKFILDRGMCIACYRRWEKKRKLELEVSL